MFTLREHADVRRGADMCNAMHYDFVRIEKRKNEKADLRRPGKKSGRA